MKKSPLGSGGVTVSGSVQKIIRCVTLCYGLGFILEMFSNLNDFMILNLALKSIFSAFLMGKSLLFAVD